MQPSELNSSSKTHRIDPGRFDRDSLSPYPGEMAFTSPSSSAFSRALAALCAATTLLASLTVALAPAVDAQSASLPDPTLSELRLGLESFAQLPDNAGRRMMELTHAGDGSGRGFVPVQEGEIWIINADGSVPSTPFLDLKTAPATANRFTKSCCAFSGLTYIAFHPDYAEQGEAGFGLLYTAHEEVPNGTPDYKISDVGNIPADQNVVNHHVIAEWRVANPLGSGANTVDASSYREVYRLEYQDEFANPHAIGELTFNPFAEPGDDDYGNLYASVGDGTNGFSLINAPWAQDISNPFGTLIRIDPLGGGRFSVPADNPYVSTPGAAAEVFAYGLRDPQTFSFGRSLDGQVSIIVADIGFGEVEEVDIVRAGDNLGWDAREGSLSVQPRPNIPITPINPLGDLVEPVAEYDHIIPSNQINARQLPATGPIALIGGFVYNGSRNHELTGQYIFGDLVRGRFWHTDLDEMNTARDANQVGAPIKELLVEVNGNETIFIDMVNPGSDRADLRFGLGEDNELYVLNKWDRTIRRLTTTAPKTCFGRSATIVGTAAADVINGTGGDDVIVGLGGSDQINGGGGNDIICGDDGNDILLGGDGNDVLLGGHGGDRIVGQGGNDRIDGETGNDTLDGSEGSDRIAGGDGDDRIDGGTGIDLLEGNGGKDTINGEDGNDTMVGGAGNDTISGGSGNDILRGNDGKDVLRGDEGDDNINAGTGNDKLFGGDGKDRLVGAKGRDRLFGNSGNDQLLGGSGKDVLKAGGGDDALNGGRGNDNCNGGGGIDTGTNCPRSRGIEK